MSDKEIEREWRSYTNTRPGFFQHISTEQDAAQAAAHWLVIAAANQAWDCLSCFGLILHNSYFSSPLIFLHTLASDSDASFGITLSEPFAKQVVAAAAQQGSGYRRGWTRG